MKSKLLEAKLSDAKFGYGTPAAHSFVDIDVAHIRKLAGLHVQITVGEAGGSFHLGKGHRNARHERGEDA
jgi:hypothetical protein